MTRDDKNQKMSKIKAFLRFSGSVNSNDTISFLTSLEKKRNATVQDCYKLFA